MFKNVEPQIVRNGTQIGPVPQFTSSKALVEAVVEEKASQKALKKATQKASKITCECGKSVLEKHLHKHLQTQKHLDWEESQLDASQPLDDIKEEELLPEEPIEETEVQYIIRMLEEIHAKVFPEA